MKRAIWIALMAGCILSSCQKAKELRYDSHDNIYFDFYPNALRDSVVYTFAYKPGLAKDTVWLPVRISGIRTDVDRKFIIKVMADSSTAVPGTHYKPFADSYIFPKIQGAVYVPLEVYNTDPSLEEKSVSLRFKLVATDDFGVAIPKLITGKVIISSKLEYPGQWWSMWLGSYYSRVKHQFFLLVTGQTSLSTEGLDAPKNLYFASLVTSFLNDPFKWISKNVDKGYVLTLRSDGNYDFYNVNSPTKKILYRKNTGGTKFFFIDESGNEVN
jgi:hypothetical protein